MSGRATKDSNQMIERFLGQRFGMFIHMGVYSMLGGEWNGQKMKMDIAEWIAFDRQIPNAAYEAAARQYNPADFDADAVVKLAKSAGMRYIVITAKHHDGFAMYHSKHDIYNLYDWTTCKRDIVEELSQACRRYGMDLGIYYSQDLDWHEEHAGGWNVEPLLGNLWDFPDNTKKDFGRYFENKVKPQVTELLTRYGDIFLIWFDTPRTISADQSEELYQLVKSLQPNCLVNSRIGNGKGDYGSLKDNQIPAVRLDQPFESPVTLNDTWGYKKDDHNWKSSDELIAMLTKLASRNVNLLLNIGPQGDGRLTADTVDILDGISRWMRVNGEAIHETGGNPASHDYDWGYMIGRRGNKIYACMHDNREQSIVLSGLLSRVNRVYRIADEQAVQFEQPGDPQRDIHSLTLLLPVSDLYMPVFVIECEEEPVFDTALQQQNRSLVLPPLRSLLYDGRLKQASDVKKGNAYLDYSRFGKMRIDNSGILAGWSKGGEYLQWEAKFVSPGRYDVEWITADDGMDERARSECEIELTVYRESALIAAMTTNLHASHAYSESRTSEDNRRVVTLGGYIDIDQAGRYKIVSKLMSDLNPDDTHIPLVAVKFVMR